MSEEKLTDDQKRLKAAEEELQKTLAKILKKYQAQLTLGMSYNTQSITPSLRWVDVSKKQ